MQVSALNCQIACVKKRRGGDSHIERLYIPYVWLCVHYVSLLATVCVRNGNIM